MDINRVGIIGGLGVDDALYGMLEHPEFYKVGIVNDFEDIRLLPSPWVDFFEGCLPKNVEGSETNDAEQKVASLQGKLLLIHSMLDPEPPVTATMRLADALQQANRDFDLLLLPNLGHATSAYTIQRTWNYLVRHLQGIEPPKDFKLSTEEE